jgi:hypothetical protein
MKSTACSIYGDFLYHRLSLIFMAGVPLVCHGIAIGSTGIAGTNPHLALNYRDSPFIQMPANRWPTLPLITLHVWFR